MSNAINGLGQAPNAINANGKAHHHGKHHHHHHGQQQLGANTVGLQNQPPAAFPGQSSIIA